MANNSNINNINLSGALNLSKNKSIIAPYEGFNRKNSPFYSSMLSPLYTQENDAVNMYINKNGDRFTWSNNNLYRNGTLIHTFTNGKILTRTAMSFTLTDGTKLLQDDVLAVYSTSVFVYRVDGGNLFFHFSSTIADIDLGIAASYMPNVEIEYSNNQYYVLINYGAESVWTSYTAKLVIVDSTGGTTTKSLAKRSHISVIRCSSAFKYALLCYPDGFFDAAESYVYFWTDANTAASPGTIKVSPSSSTDVVYACIVADGSFIFKTPVAVKDSTYYKGVPAQLTAVSSIEMYISGKLAVSSSSVVSVTYKTSYAQSFNCTGYGSTYSDGVSLSTLRIVPPEEDYSKYFTSKNYARVSHMFMLPLVTGDDGTYSAVNAFISYDSAGNISYTSGTGYFGYDGSSAYDVGGTRAPLNWITKPYWWLLATKDGIQGLSYASGTSTRGTLLCPWNDIDDSRDITFNNNFFIYFSASEKKWVSLALTYHVPTYRVYNGTLFVNSVENVNCYNMEDDKPGHYADDWNNRIHSWGASSESTASTCVMWSLIAHAIASSITSAMTLKEITIEGSTVKVPALSSVMEYFTSFYISSAVNAMYQVTGSDDISMITPPQQVFALSIDNDNAFSVAKTSVQVTGSYFSSNPVDIFYDKVSTGVCTYQLSYVNDSLAIKRGILEGMELSVSEGYSYNLPLSSDWKMIVSYTNNDMADIDGVAYPIKYNFSKPVMIYTLYGGIEDVKAAFVIQGQSFLIIGSKIYAVTYSNYDVNSTQVICDITGMIYLGATDKVAYFFCPFNRKIRIFSASNTIEDLAEASEIEEVGNSFFNPQTESIYVSTDKGLYVITSTNGMYRLDIMDVDDIQFLDDMAVISTGESTTIISYEEQEDFERQPVELETMFYGAGNNVKSVNDCVYIRLWDNGHKAGTVEVSLTTYTDEGKTSDVKKFTVKPSDWDSKTDQIYLRWQPKMMSSQGASFAIKSDFAISSLSIGSQASTMMLSKENI